MGFTRIGVDDDRNSPELPTFDDYGLDAPDISSGDVAHGTLEL